MARPWVLLGYVAWVGCSGFVGSTEDAESAPVLGDAGPMAVDAASSADATTGVDAGTPSPVMPVESFSCLEELSGPATTKHFDWEGRCNAFEDDAGCYYYDYRGLHLSDGTRFDQRGVEGYQVTFPVVTDRWQALGLGLQQPDRTFCYAGGAHIGRNPLAMTWGDVVGSKSRKNNFLAIDAGTLRVEGARVHNIHDTFYGARESFYQFRHTWVTWNRDDFYEGFLHNVHIADTLIDGTFSFISDPDGDCTDEKRASDRTLVIENSLIRLQRMPGPFGMDDEGTWHWKVVGGHGNLWKLDSCGWPDWPQFELRNNVFLIEGPTNTRWQLYDPGRCNMGLPSACNSGLSNVSVCENNLFLYADYHHWSDEGLDPGAVPKPGDPFYNPDNPDYLENGVDCYQRITDDPNDPGFGDVTGVWWAMRQAWIDSHTTASDPNHRVMQIPGVDVPALVAGRAYQMRNVASGLCVEGAAGTAVPTMAPCGGGDNQRWTVEVRDDGKLMGAILLRGTDGVLRTQDPMILENDNSDANFDPSVFLEPVDDASGPAFAERWYVLPLENEPGGAPATYAIESDAIRRSFVLATDDGSLEVQPFYVDGENTPLPQAEFASGGDARLQWYLEEVP